MWLADFVLATFHLKRPPRRLILGQVLQLVAILVDCPRTLLCIRQVAIWKQAILIVAYYYAVLL